MDAAICAFGLCEGENQPDVVHAFAETEATAIKRKLLFLALGQTRLARFSSFSAPDSRPRPRKRSFRRSGMRAAIDKNNHLQWHDQDEILLHTKKRDLLNSPSVVSRLFLPIH